MRFGLLPSTLLALCTAFCAAQTSTEALRLNQIQVIGTHNSYHAGIPPSEALLWKQKNAEAFTWLDYQHKPLTEQLNGGVRQIELDIFADSKGGLFADPAGPKAVAAAHLAADAPFDPAGVMRQPGFKVLHMQDVDYRSVCQPFTACLAEVRQWSKAHPGHAPIFILVETKQDQPRPGLQFTRPEPFTAEIFKALDAEIRSVFTAEEMITPDDVRGSYPTLNKAVLAGNWPTLQAARGKVVFLLDQQPARPLYLEVHPGLRGGVLFTNSVAGADDAAFLERNEGHVEEIRSLVEKGYLVRTRTDANTQEARQNRVARRDATLRSGAQILSTDYPPNEPARWRGHYKVEFKSHQPVRCNVVNAPAGCAIEPGL